MGGFEQTGEDNRNHRRTVKYGNYSGLKGEASTIGDAQPDSETPKFNRCGIDCPPFIPSFAGLTSGPNAFRTAAARARSTQINGPIGKIRCIPLIVK